MCVRVYEEKEVCSISERIESGKIGFSVEREREKSESEDV